MRDSVTAFATVEEGEGGKGWGMAVVTGDEGGAVRFVYSHWMRGWWVGKC